MRKLILAGAIVALVNACSGQSDTSSKKLLDLGGEANAAAQSPQTSGEGTTVAVPRVVAAGARHMGTTAEAVLKVGEESVAEAQGAHTAQSVIDYCRYFADVLTRPEDMHKCLRLVRVDATWRLNMPGVSDMTSAASTAASMSVLRRFAFCTSDQVVRHMHSFKDYDICMPQQVQASLQEALTEAMWKSRESAGVGPPAFPYANPFSHAATLTAEERVAYCAIPAIAEGFGPGDLEKCHKGIDELAQTSNLDSQNQSGSVMDAHAALRSASKMRSQEDRSAFCNRSDVLNVLTPEQVQECEVGLSPDNPGEHALTDDDPGYRDE